jgi:hypothetical protein
MTKAPAESSVAALAALYQGEKTDAAYIFNTAMALMGIALGYLIAAVPVVANLSATGLPPATKIIPHAWVYLLLLPLPLILVMEFHTLITLNAMMHGVSVAALEDQLVAAAHLNTPRKYLGSRAGDQIMDVTQSRPIHQLVTNIVYGGVASCVLLFVLYALLADWPVISRDPQITRRLIKWALWAIMFSTYAVLAVIAARSWNIGQSVVREGRAAIGDKPSTTSREESWFSVVFGRPRVLLARLLPRGIASKLGLLDASRGTKDQS